MGMPLFEWCYVQDIFIRFASGKLRTINDLISAESKFQQLFTMEDFIEET